MYCWLLKPVFLIWTEKTSWQQMTLFVTQPYLCMGRSWESPDISTPYSRLHIETLSGWAWLMKWWWLQRIVVKYLSALTTQLWPLSGVNINSDHDTGMGWGQLVTSSSANCFPWFCDFTLINLNPNLRMYSSPLVPLRLVTKKECSPTNFWAGIPSLSNISGCVSV